MIDFGVLELVDQSLHRVVVVYVDGLFGLWFCVSISHYKLLNTAIIRLGFMTKKLKSFKLINSWEAK